MRPKELYFLWIISVIATMGSLYFSNIMMLPPCSLCWWQRICMYPLSIIFAVAFLRKDENVNFYTFPILIIGWFISLYHNLLYYNFIEKSIIPCTAGVSCTSIQLNWLGFITIPLLALTAFSLLLIISVLSIIKKGQTNE